MGRAAGASPGVDHAGALVYAVASMNLINRDTDYAVRALCAMARRPEGMHSAAGLAPELQVPRPYLRRVLQTLARRGLLRSFRGRGGGFMLNRDPERIALTEVIELFQGKVELTRCLLQGKPCRNRSRCPLRRTVREIEELAVRKLRETTIASLLP